MKVQSIEDASRIILTKIHNGETVDQKAVNELKKRKLVKLEKRISFLNITKGPKFATEIVKEETDLTAEVLAR